MSNPRINKREREKAKRERAVAKAERRTERRAAGDDEVAAATPADETAVLRELADLHRRFDAEEIGFDDFVAEKEALMGRLQVR